MLIHNAVMTIPFTILWRAKLTLKHTLVLVGLFSLVFITVFVALVRTAISMHLRKGGGWFYLTADTLLIFIEANVG